MWHVFGRGPAAADSFLGRCGGSSDASVCPARVEKYLKAIALLLFGVLLGGRQTRGAVGVRKNVQVSLFGVLLGGACNVGTVRGCAVSVRSCGACNVRFVLGDWRTGGRLFGGGGEGCNLATAGGCAVSVSSWVLAVCARCVRVFGNVDVASDRTVRGNVRASLLGVLWRVRDFGAHTCASLRLCVVGGAT